ncbi:DNA topoisomerase [Macleaya cordata]|uniref:DNA topoisomerase n=1 Tax=Macleaya cordata TaxID=56857 RepID=A0A200QY58_MACCD|nr:DNA topoisomerase [Macleaya cordata]
MTLQSQCRGVKNYLGAQLPCSSTGNRCTYGKFGQLQFRKAREGCRIITNQFRDLKFKVDYDSQFLRTLSGRYRHEATFLFQPQLSARVPFTMKSRNMFTVGNSVRLNVFSYECNGRRLFSDKANQKSYAPNTSLNRSDNVSVRDGGSEDIKSSRKAFYALRKRGKSLAVRNSSFEGGKQVAISSASDTSKPVAKTVDVLRPKEQVIRAGKKDVQSGSSILAVAKINDNNQKRKAPVKKKQKLKNKEHVQGDTGTSVLSGATEARGSKGVSQPVKKPNITKDSRPSQTSEFIPVCEKCLPAVDNPGLVHHQSKKKKIDKSTRHREPKKNVKVKNSDKAPFEQSNSVGRKLEPRRKTLSPLYPPTGKSVVVVESITKANVIQGYLGDMFEVLPSNGHVRVLASWSGSVRPDDGFSMVWGVPSAAWTHLKSIKVALQGAKNLILACDPDREGEAIAWHITEMLQQQDALHENITVARVAFNEITESSIKIALQSPRDINMDLVHAYLARGALDYLIAYRMTPLLGKKLPGCLSAGRVQSAALALVCDRETEIDEFKPREYWTVEVEFSKKELGSLDKAISFSSHLINIDSKKLEQLSIGLSTEAKDIQKKIASSTFKVVGFKRTKTRKNPPKPYVTSTLQQDAANKLHFSASYTMKLAKELYEGVKLSNDEATGLITYMRTDGLHISDVAVEDIRSLVLERYGHDFAPKSARKYFKKVKNAEEAHEAIRPTDMRRLPSMLSGVLDKDSLKLYTLIWSRTMACQMEPTMIDQLQVDIGGAGQSILLRSTRSKVEFLGFQAAYKDVEAAAIRYNEEEGNVGEEAFKSLSALKSGDPLHLGKVELKQHFTQSPPRYTEGSLIKKLEELGIGRPSTYAAVIKVLQDRNYLTVKSQVFHPEFRARMVSQFLSHLFSEVNDYSFTADMENELDNVSAGFTEWKGLMKDYWARFSMYCSRAGNMDVRQIEKIMEEAFADFLFGSLPGKSRTCPSCSEGTLIFKVTGSGAGYFIACDKHPKCKYIAKTICRDEEEEEEETPETAELYAEPKVLGVNPGSNEKIFVKNGPYGLYVQLGEDRKGYSPKRAHVSGIKDVDSITFEHALDLLRYPVTLGKHPDDGQPVYLRLANVGFSIKHRRTNAPVPKNMNPKSITLEKAVKLLLSKDAKKCGRPKNMPKAEIYEAM